MTVQATEQPTKGGILAKFIGPGKTMWTVAIGLALVTGFGAFSILGDAASTETYYVINQPVPARTQVTADMLEPREAKVDQAPPNAFDMVYVRDNDVFSQVALHAGDVLSPSNAGPLGRITDNVPANFVAASFEAAPDIAVAGKVRSGDFIDIIATSDSSDNGTKAKVVLQHVLITDVTVSPGTISSNAVSGQEGDELAPGPESSAVRGGIPSIYTVAVSAEDATKLALVRNYDIYVVLSANLPAESMNVETHSQSLFTGSVSDSSAGTSGSIFVKRYELAFNPGNVYVDNEGTTWQVNTDGVWTSTKDTLDAGDIPAGYLAFPAGLTYTDADGTAWLTEAQTDTGTVVWTSKSQTLPEGDAPEGYSPNKSASPAEQD